MARRLTLFTNQNRILNTAPQAITSARIPEERRGNQKTRFANPARGLAWQSKFKTRVADLKNAIKQLLVNRGEFKETDLADLFVSECVATLRTAGTSTELPVNGTSLGTVRVPLPALQVIAKISGTFKSKDISVQVEDGSIKLETFRHRNPGITLRILPNQRIDLPVDASLLDTLGVGAILTQHEIEEQGLTSRMLEAWERANRAITSASSSLWALGVSEQQIRALVEGRVKAAGERLRETFKNSST